jgi:hypothetical protein
VNVNTSTSFDTTTKPQPQGSMRSTRLHDLPPQTCPPTRNKYYVHTIIESAAITVEHLHSGARSLARIVSRAHAPLEYIDSIPATLRSKQQLDGVAERALLAVPSA